MNIPRSKLTLARAGLLLGAFMVIARINGATFSATTDFVPSKDPVFSPYYRETNASLPTEHGVAIDTLKHRAQPAAAELVFAGPTGSYDVTLIAVAEEDGESSYRFIIDGQDQGVRQNPPQSAKRTPVPHRWAGVTLKTGGTIQVVFAGHTNEKIPEGAGTAWSRGRWRSLTVTASPAAKAKDSP